MIMLHQFGDYAVFTKRDFRIFAKLAQMVHGTGRVWVHHYFDESERWAFRHDVVKRLEREDKMIQQARVGLQQVTEPAWLRESVSSIRIMLADQKLWAPLGLDECLKRLEGFAEVIEQLKESLEGLSRTAQGDNDVGMTTLARIDKVKVELFGVETSLRKINESV